jgi:tRNA A37 threonylcarbamoyladenosine biosynthesis protein TsaE
MLYLITKQDYYICLSFLDIYPSSPTFAILLQSGKIANTVIKHLDVYELWSTQPLFFWPKAFLEVDATIM